MDIPQEPMYQGQVLTVDEAAQRLNMDAESVQEMLNAGDLPHRTMDGERLISEDDLDTFRTRNRLRPEWEGSNEVPRPLINPPGH